MDLLKIKKNSYLADAPVTVGYYIYNNELLLIDTGTDRTIIRSILNNHDNVKIKYIFNTHSHSDHISCNNYIQKNHDVTTIAPFGEHNFIEFPALEPIYLYGGTPPKQMKNKNILAKPSVVDIIINNEKENINLKFGKDNVNFKFINLNGHAYNQLGIITPDNIAYLGDALLLENYIKKHKLIFLYNVEDQLKTLERLKSLNCDYYALSHNGVFENIDDIIDANLKSIEFTIDLILDTLNVYTSLEELHMNISKKLNLVEKLPGYFLNHSVIKAYVTYLYENNKIDISMDTNNSRIILNKI